MADRNYIDNIASVQKHLHSNLQSAISRHKEFADRHRIPAPSFEVEDKVWLDARNIRTTLPAKKLSERRLGPFRIEAVIGKSAYRLSLPPKWQAIHPVFHVSLLEPVQPSNLSSQHKDPPKPVEILDHVKWEVSSILDSRL